MGKLRKSILIAMFIAFVVGAILFIYPFFRGFFLDWRMKDSAGSFLEQMEAPDTSFSTPENPGIHEESLPTEETIPNEALWNAVHDYNQQIWEERQSELTDPWAYQQPSFTLEDFGMEDEIFGVISIPEIELEMASHRCGGKLHVRAVRHTPVCPVESQGALHPAHRRMECVREKL